MGLKKNFIYSSLSGTMQYLVILVTFPYVSRVLGVSNIGLVNFVDNTVNYFLLFATMGITLLGIREIAKNKDNPIQMKSTFSSLFFIHGVLTIFVLVIYIFSILIIPKLSEYKEFFFIGIAKIIFSFFLIEWFYKGIEDFKYITIRNIIIRVIYILLIFLFIKEEDDYVLYFGLTTGIVVINAIINYIYSFNFVKFSFNHISIKKYIIPFFTLGIYTLLTSMYTTFNVVYLGFVSDNVQVGFYTTALKLYVIILSLFAAFTGVMLPRMSALFEQEDKGAFKQMLGKSFSFLFAFCFPLIIGTVILAPQIISLMAGNDYSGAIIPMQIIMPLIMIVGIAQILAIQVLMPMRKDKVVLYASIVGAVIGVLLNFVLVKRFACIGTAIVLMISESLVTAFYIIALSKEKIFNFPWNLLFKNLIYSLPYVALCLIFLQLGLSSFLTLILAVIACIFYFFILQYFVIKDSFILGLLKRWI
ncbi:O-antigen/teichoic acid export membrane protein [Dysgonomonas alginatilytica]|uniref:O-antigen/teichoic acid export membrane protein n=1 Tax=Dysgonomonas alginatilytica TaxID=1605892 RepID=A0A2V3PSX9_9BACT|nr:flippase [Dysgonomonas alginatilytica]PXV62189.1 O-antigen/teichoic acid export membrane protein [Dysgonomonas alginatilytica]